MIQIPVLCEDAIMTYGNLFRKTKIFLVNYLLILHSINVVRSPVHKPKLGTEV